VDHDRMAVYGSVVEKRRRAAMGLPESQLASATGQKNSPRLQKHGERVHAVLTEGFNGQSWGRVRLAAVLAQR
jgi:hypothetical protein